MLNRSICGLLLTLAMAPAQPLAIRGVTVIDATGKAAQSGMTVLVERGRISAVGPAQQLKLAKNTKIIDGRGKFLIPGLWDMHTHNNSRRYGGGPKDDLFPISFPLEVANGIVGAREMKGPGNANEWRQEEAKLPGPRPTIWLGSPLTDGPNPTWPDSKVIKDAAEGRAWVREQKQNGAAFIKVYSKLSRESFFAIADEARRLGIPFAGHVPNFVLAEEASDAGMKSMEHMYQIALSCSRREEELFKAELAGAGLSATLIGASESFDPAKAEALFQRFIRNGTWQCPTLTVLRSTGAMDDPKFTNDARVKYIPESFLKTWDPTATMSGLNDVQLKARRIQLRVAMDLTGRMYRAGVRVLAGSDSWNPYVFPGFSLHDELALLVEAGLPPMAALQAATRNAAEWMGTLPERGTIETGKIADLVLLDGNPLVDIHNTQRIAAVVLRGELLDRKTLDSLLEKAVQHE